jgi:hypothetical protein
MCVQLSWDGGVSWTAAKSTATLMTSNTSRDFSLDWVAVRVSY